MFADGTTTLDQLVKLYIRMNFDHQFTVVSSSEDAYRLEGECRGGEQFGVKPLLNPA